MKLPLLGSADMSGGQIGRLLAVLFVLSFLLVPGQQLRADELRPAYVELNQKDQTHWELVWKASARSRLGQEGRVTVPQNCSRDGDTAQQLAGSNIIRRARLTCTDTIIGQQVGLEGLALSTTDALVRIAPLNSETLTYRLTPDSTKVQIAADNPITAVAATYTILGIEHILLGFDHLLFVLALVLLLKSGWLVVQTVTAFTIAHSITLIGTSLGYLALPSRPVEAVIALSIMFVALEIVKSQPGDPRLSERYPWIIAFLFGLLHGFGFAGALAEIGLPADDTPKALLTFNIGVEIGQLAIVAAALALLAILRRYRDSWSGPVKIGTAYGIGSLATYWFIERMIA